MKVRLQATADETVDEISSFFETNFFEMSEVNIPLCVF